MDKVAIQPTISVIKSPSVELGMSGSDLRAGKIGRQSSVSPALSAPSKENTLYCRLRFSHEEQPAPILQSVQS